MTNKTLKKMINDEIEQLKPDRSVLDKAKSIMTETQYNSVEINGDTAVIKKKFGLTKLMLILAVCVIAVSMCVCLPLVFMQDNGTGGGVGAVELTKLPVPSLSQNEYAMSKGLLYFKDDGTIINSNTLATKYSNQTEYISLSENLVFTNYEKNLEIYLNGNKLSDSYYYDILTNNFTIDNITVTYGNFDVSYVGWDGDENNIYTKQMRGKFEHNQATYYFEIYGHETINIQDVMNDLLKK